MRVLLLHPSDAQHRGAWSGQSWDLIVNLGRSTFFRAEKAPKSCGVLQLDSYSQGLADARLVRDLLRAGRGALVDNEGLDWWDLASLDIVQQAFTVVRSQRLAAEIHGATEIWSTRPDWCGKIVADLLHLPLHSFRPSKSERIADFATHYARVFRHFSPAQIQQIFFDKYDAGYRWRSRFAPKADRCSKPVVLIPSAYANVSRMAADYAALVPGQDFLLVATRRSAHEFRPTKNIEVHSLGAYARVRQQEPELVFLMERWTRLKSDLHSCEGLRLLSAAGALDPLSRFFQSGLSVRDAWSQVLERQPVLSVLCGDDSNIYTRLPVLLANRRNIPTIDFHHGALDGFYLFKDLTCDLYLAKGEMERDYLLRLCRLPETKIVIAPPSTPQRLVASRKSADGNIILFSEPYEIGGIRAEDVYREVLPRLWLLAERYGRDLVIKLHPFESRSQRRRIVKRILPEEAARRVRWIEGPLTPQLFEHAWFGITIESTTAIDCAQNGVCCFLCRWLKLLPYGYAEQYVRFGVGEPLESAEHIEKIPSRLEEVHNRLSTKSPQRTDGAQFRQWLTSGRLETAETRSIHD